MLNDIFELYQLGLEQKILIHNGQLTDRTYTNIVTVGNLLNNTEFINHFIKNYTALLPKNIQRDAETWANAHTIYNNGQYQSCVDLLISHQFSHHLFSIQTRVLLLQAYFDLNKSDSSYYEYLIHYCTSFNKFIRRDKVISAERKKSYLHLIKYAKNLATAVYKKETSPKYLQDLRTKLDSEKNIQGKSWLLKSMTQLKQTN